MEKILGFLPTFLCILFRSVSTLLLPLQLLSFNYTKIQQLSMLFLLLLLLFLVPFPPTLLPLPPLLLSFCFAEFLYVALAVMELSIHAR